MWNLLSNKDQLNSLCPTTNGDLQIMQMAKLMMLRWQKFIIDDRYYCSIDTSNIRLIVEALVTTNNQVVLMIQVLTVR